MRFTSDTDDCNQRNIKQDKAIIILFHVSIILIKKLDNIVTPYIQDVIRATSVVDENNWYEIWNINMGFYDKEKDYVVEADNFLDFFQYLLKN